MNVSEDSGTESTTSASANHTFSDAHSTFSNTGNDLSTTSRLQQVMRHTTICTTTPQENGYIFPQSMWNKKQISQSAGSVLIKVKKNLL